MLNKLFVVCLFVLACSFNVCGKVPQNTFITVEASGVGANHDDALRDAFKDAVRKVVGVYAITQSKMLSSSQADDLFDEKIYLNADAVVTDYKLLQKTENDGVITIKLKATVVKNDLQKYVKQQKTNQISDTEIANLLNKVDVIDEAEKSLEYIFKDYASKLYQIRRVGNFSLRSDNVTSEDIISLDMNFEIKFNEEYYCKLKERLQNLLSKIAIEQRSGTVIVKNSKNHYNDGSYESYGEYNNKEYGNIRNEHSHIINPKRTHTAAIFFVDRKMQKEQTQSYEYRVYDVPRPIFRKLQRLISNFNIIIFDFHMKKQNISLNRFLKALISFWQTDDEYFIAFNNWIDISLTNSDCYKSVQYSVLSGEFQQKWEFPKDQIRLMKSCTFQVHSGRQAKYIWSLNNNLERSMSELAYVGYLPAMITMAEKYDKSWYHNAALLGSNYAQQKIGWKNKGLGFEIIAEDNCFIVHSAPQGCGIFKGWVLKSINGDAVPRYSSNIDYLSKKIGDFRPGEPVVVEFTNGKKIRIKTK